MAFSLLPKSQTIRKDLLEDGNGEFHEALQEGVAEAGIIRIIVHEKRHTNAFGQLSITAKFTSRSEKSGEK